MFESVKNQWENLSYIARAIFLCLLTLLMVALVYSVTWSLKEDYQVLFSDLSSQDASGMIAELDRLKTPYKLAENGTSILVEKDTVYKTRLKLVGKGLNLNGSVGFELFNNSEFGMTEFAQKVNYLRALQGELERTIMGFDEIKSARVHLVLPESGLFKRKDAIPKASVTISVRDSAQLTSDQILGIQKLVAASVPEVTRSEVTIVDQRGIALTKNIAGDTEAFVYERLDVKKQLENYMTQKLISVLDRVIGTGQAIVSVDISLNYDQVKITKEDIIPLPHTFGQSVGAITRKRTSNQVDEVGAAQPSTFTEDQASVGRDAPPSASTSEVEYINNRRVEQVLSSPGAVSKLSVGVVVPNINDPIKLAKIKEIVSMVAGINVSRGDGLVVHDIDMPNIMGDRGALENVPSVDLSQNLQVAQSQPVTNVNLLYWPYLLLASLFILGAFLFFRRKKVQINKPISDESRAKLLNDINAWAGSQHSTKI